MMITNHSFELGFEPATYGLQTYFTTVHRSINWAIEGLTNREWLFISCELLVHNAFCQEKKLHFTPSSRIWTSDLWITNLLYYSPPLYQLSYRRFDEREWHFISCELLVHNAFVKKKNDKLLRAGFEPATYGLQTYFTTVHRSTNWAIGFNECEWHFISCELLVHNAFCEEQKLYLTPSGRIWTSDL